MTERASHSRATRSGVLAGFLRAQRDSIVALFTRRVQEGLAPSSASPREVVDHLPRFLDEVASILSGEWVPGKPTIARSGTAEEHGRQRLSIGYDLRSLVREYGVLRDCIFEKLEEEGVSPGLRELRILSDCLSEAVADSVNQYVHERDADSDAERGHLIELFEQAPGFACFLRGPSLVFELANDAYYQLVGHREVIGKPLREAIPEIEGQGYFELIEQVFASGEPFAGREVKMLLQREPGAPLSEVFLDFVYQPIRGTAGEVTGIFVQGHDVTEVKREGARREAAEAALRQSEERYRTLFESIDDGFCLMQMIVDDQGKTVDYRFLEANEAFASHTGLANAVGKTARELVPDLDASWFELYGRVAETGETARFENHAPAMEDRWFDVYASRVGKPELRQVALVFKDVTAKKRADEEREQLLARESSAREEAEEAGRLRDEFLATVSHELRTPLNSMLGWVQMLRAGTLSAERQGRALETIERNARAQTQLIEDLLDVSSILAGKLRLEIEPLDVREIVEAAIETARPAAEAKKMRLQAVVSSTGTVMGDPHRLQQVVWNLLSNAVKFTPKGGRVQVLVERRDSSVDITVADTGQGIPKDFQSHIFERFRQVDGGTTRAHGGLGLGLAIVRQLVEMHGGTIQVFSEGTDRGSSFTVRLPLAVMKSREASSPRALQVAALSHGFKCPPELDGLRVLLVDDEEDTREMLRTLLDGCLAKVRLAASAAEGLRLFQADPPDILLSDVGMPDEDGYSFIAKVRALPLESGGEVPAVALTAYARTEDRTRALLAGFSSHVPKPVEPLELVAVITSLARGRKRPTS
jgi:PAS domain S-box-containing protein